MGWVFRLGMPTLGGLVFGVAMIRSGGLALPIGLHLGGNWVQARWPRNPTAAATRCARTSG